MQHAPTSDAGCPSRRASKQALLQPRPPRAVSVSPVRSRRGRNKIRRPQHENAADRLPRSFVERKRIAPRKSSVVVPRIPIHTLIYAYLSTANNRLGGMKSKIYRHKVNVVETQEKGFCNN